MSKTRRLVTAAACAVGITAGTVLSAGPAMAATATYDCEISGSGAPTPDYDNVLIGFFNNFPGQLVIVTLGMPTRVDLPAGTLSAVTSGASPISLANDVPLPRDEEMEVQTETATAVPSLLPTTITFTLSISPASISIVCVKQ
jgi:hypothetical protein